MRSKVMARGLATIAMQDKKTMKPIR